MQVLVFKEYIKEKNKADKALGKIAKNLGISIDELRKI